MAAYGIPEADIATVIGIDPKTLRRHYRRELDTGHIKANTKVAENLYRRATGESREAVTAAIFWLKTRARWREAPQTHEVVHSEFNEMTKEQLEDYISDASARLGFEPLRRKSRTAAAMPAIEHDPAEPARPRRGH
jgi:hypothetical protein